MKIVTKEELAKIPARTLFSFVNKTKHSCEIHGLNILTGAGLEYSNGRIGWNGELVLFEPDIRCVDDKRIYTNWSTVDRSDIDYDDDTLFAVYTKNEIKQMIEWLNYALEPDKRHNIDMDHWYGADEDDILDDDQMEALAGY